MLLVLISLQMLSILLIYIMMIMMTVYCSWKFCYLETACGDIVVFVGNSNAGDSCFGLGNVLLVVVEPIAVLVVMVLVGDVAVITDYAALVVASWC